MQSFAAGLAIDPWLDVDLRRQSRVGLTLAPVRRFPWPVSSSQDRHVRSELAESNRQSAVQFNRVRGFRLRQTNESLENDDWRPCSDDLSLFYREHIDAVSCGRGWNCCAFLSARLKRKRGACSSQTPRLRSDN